MMRCKVFLSGYFLICLLSCLSCGKHERAKTKQLLRLNFTYEPTTMDPRKGSDPVTSLTHFMLYEGLTKLTPVSTHEPACAEKIDLSEDRLTYTFHLRDSCWTNGDPVTAFDFEYAWKTLLDSKFPCPNAHLFYPIKNAEAVKKGFMSTDALGIRAIDSRTLEVTLEKPTPYFLDLTSFCVFFPVPKKIAESDPSWSEQQGTKLISNGPFTLASWRKCNELIFVKNTNYWDKERPKLDRVEVSIINNAMTALGMYQQGQLDFLGDALTPIPADWIKDLASKGLLHSRPIGGCTFTTFNINKFPFHNKNIRKAFSYAIDRKAIIENITQHNEIVATGCVPPVLKGNENKAFFPDGNLEIAREYFAKGLEELQVKKEDLNGLVFNYFSNDTYRRIVQTLQQQWRAAFDINIVLEESDFKVNMDKLNRKDYQFGFSMMIIQYNDPMGILDRFKLKNSPKNYPGFDNKTYADLLDQSSQVTTEEERRIILEDAEKLIAEELPFAPVFHFTSVYLKKDRVKGFYISPIGSIHLNDVYIEE